jgi:hypothetical protein
VRAHRELEGTRMSRRTRARLLAESLAAAGLAALCFAGAAYADEPSDPGAGATTKAPGESAGETRQIPLRTPEEQAAYEADMAKQAETRAAWLDYGKSVLNRYGVGFNSLITFPADPIMDTVKPREEFDKLPLGVVTRYFAGLGTGVLLSMYRAGMGAFDVIFAPLTPMKELSPEPRWIIFPGVEPEGF